MTPSKLRLNALGRRLRRAALGADELRTDGRCRAAPEWLVVAVNNFCNLHCRMCDVGLGVTESPFWANLIGDDPRNMSLDLFESVVDEARRFRPAPKIGLAFTEPLLHKEILQFCAALSRRNLYGTITTNGYLLPDLAQGLVEGGIDLITVSVDGPREVHDRVRGSEGSFHRIYEGIRIVHRVRARTGRENPRIQLSYTITDENCGDMVRFLKEIEPLAPDFVTFSHLNFVTDEMASAHNALHGGRLAVTRSNLGQIDPGKIDLDALWNELRALNAHVRGTPFRVTLVPDFSTIDGLRRFYREPLTFVGGRRCTDPFRMMMVQTDGTVIPAHGRCYHYPVGKVPESSLAEIWNGKPFRGFRRTLREAGGTLPACSRCCGVIGKPGAERS